MKHTSGELKKMARIALNGRWSYPIFLSLLYSFIAMGLSLVTTLFGLGTTTYAKILSWTASTILSLILGLFSVGLQYAYLNLSRGKLSTLKDLTIAFRMSPDRFLIVAFITELASFLVSIPSYFITDLSEQTVTYLILLLTINILTLLISCFFGLSNYLLLDFPELGALEALRASIKLMKGNKWRYLYIRLSFIGLILLSTCTFFVSLIWVEPYMHMTMAFFYTTILYGAGIYPPGMEPQSHTNEPDTF